MSTAAASRVIDTDILAPQIKRAKVGGSVYEFPGDCPLEVFVTIQGFQARLQEGIDEADLLPEMQDIVLKLFQVRQPRMTKLPDGIGLLQLMGLVGRIYADTPDPPVPARKRAAKKQPTPRSPRKAAGTRSTSRARTSG